MSVLYIKLRLHFGTPALVTSVARVHVDCRLVDCRLSPGGLSPVACRTGAPFHFALGLRNADPSVNILRNADLCGASFETRIPLARCGPLRLIKLTDRSTTTVTQQSKMTTSASADAASAASAAAATAARSAKWAAEFAQDHAAHALSDYNDLYDMREAAAEAAEAATAAAAAAIFEARAVDAVHFAWPGGYRVPWHSGARSARHPASIWSTALRHGC